MMMMTTTGQTELRFLSAGDRRRLSDLLDPADGWRELASRILVPDPSDRSGSQSLRFLISPHNMRILDQQRHIPGSSPTQVLFDFWSTTGRRNQRPNLDQLLSLLIDCRLTRAAKFVAAEILGQDFCDNCPAAAAAAASAGDWNRSLRPDLGFASSSCCGLTSTSGYGNHLHVSPTAPVPSISITSADLMSQLNELEQDQPDISVSDCPAIPFNLLANAANGFSEEGICSHKIGEGAFGSVFKACLPDGKLVAIKVLKSELLDQQFVNEVEMMRKFRHQNLLPLIGISTDGPSPCLVYKYMALGSVNRFLEFSGQDLISSARLLVAIGTARGLAYLHTAFPQPFVHRDVKSDNILLDSDLSPKIGDFGLTRIGSAGTGMTRSRQMTQNVIGTSAYMAPEAFRGDVSVKLDAFAFGVVLIELLTGLKPYDEERDEKDLLDLMEEKLDHWSDEDYGGQGIVILLDRKVPDWDLQMAQQLSVIAKKATDHRKKSRPTVTQMLQSLERLLTGD